MIFDSSIFLNLTLSVKPKKGHFTTKFVFVPFIIDQGNAAFLEGAQRKVQKKQQQKTDPDKNAYITTDLCNAEIFPHAVRKYTTILEISSWAYVKYVQKEHFSECTKSAYFHVLKTE